MRTKIILLSIIYCLLSIGLCGCEAFRKKFVRKPKREKEVKVVVNTQEYPLEHSAGQLYEKYYLFWRAAHEDLVGSLEAQDGNRKKRISAARKIVEYLQEMRKLLLPEKQKELDELISAQKDTLKQLDKFRLGRAEKLRIKSMLRKQKRQIQKEFNYRHIQEYLVKP